MSEFDAPESGRPETECECVLLDSGWAQIRQPNRETAWIESDRLVMLEDEQ